MMMELSVHSRRQRLRVKRLLETTSLRRQSAIAMDSSANNDRSRRRFNRTAVNWSIGTASVLLLLGVVACVSPSAATAMAVGLVPALAATGVIAQLLFSRDSQVSVATLFLHVIGLAALAVVVVLATVILFGG
jgi:hypothetical protein